MLFVLFGAETEEEEEEGVHHLICQLLCTDCFAPICICVSFQKGAPNLHSLATAAAAAPPVHHHLPSLALIYLVCFSAVSVAFIAIAKQQLVLSVPLELLMFTDALPICQHSPLSWPSSPPLPQLVLLHFQYITGCYSLSHSATHLK